MVTSVPSSTTITITMPSNESGSGATTSGGIRVQHYYPVGPAVQAKGFGWSLGSWGGTATGVATTTITSGISDSATTGIILTDASLFPKTGTSFIKINDEEISYTGISASNAFGSQTLPDSIWAPTAEPFSTTHIDISFEASIACCFSLIAVDNPAGPAPTMTTSYSIDSLSIFSILLFIVLRRAAVIEYAL